MTRARVRKAHFTKKKSKSLCASANYRRRAKGRLGSHSCRRDRSLRTLHALTNVEYGSLFAFLGRRPRRYPSSHILVADGRALRPCATGPETTRPFPSIGAFW